MEKLDFNGYLTKGPKEKLNLELSFQYQLDPKNQIKGFSLRLREKKDGLKLSESREMGVFLTPREWQKLIKAMQAEAKGAQEAAESLE